MVRALLITFESSESQLFSFSQTLEMCKYISSLICFLDAQSQWLPWDGKSAKNFIWIIFSTDGSGMWCFRKQVFNLFSGLIHGEIRISYQKHKALTSLRKPFTVRLQGPLGFFLAALPSAVPVLQSSWTSRASALLIYLTCRLPVFLGTV